MGSATLVVVEACPLWLLFAVFAPNPGAALNSTAIEASTRERLVLERSVALTDASSKAQSEHLPPVRRRLASRSLDDSLILVVMSE